jgi:glycosyltransferase involved in cell wall biosynthesis
MAMPIDVSVIMATYRRPGTIVQSIQSALRQRGCQIEVLVVDDCPDGSAEVTVRGIGDPRVRYLRNPAPSGGRPAVPRNFALPLAQGEIVHFLDDDDIVPQGHYEAALAEFKRQPGLGLVFGRIEAFGDDEEKVRADQRLFDLSARRAKRSQLLGGPSWAFTARLIFQDVMFVCGAAMFRRSCGLEVGGMDTSMKILEDIEFYARVIRLSGGRFMDRVSLRYRVGHSLMHRADIMPDIVQNYLHMQGKFRRTHGALEFYALKITARSLFRVI